jgi:hypothetical protein|eukprot:COSAG06_NODE_2065_length_7685_cov_1179.280649_7_plen_69_part_00
MRTTSPTRGDGKCLFNLRDRSQADLSEERAALDHLGVGGDKLCVHIQAAAGALCTLQGLHLSLHTSDH